MSHDFPLHTLETAPEEVRPALESALASIGFIPTMMAKWAEAPVLLHAYRAVTPFFEKSSLKPEERLVVFMTASYAHNCDFCMSAHSWGAVREGVDGSILAALRSGSVVPDAKLEALRLFVLKLIVDRGAVTDADRKAFFAAGFTPRQALEVVLGVAIKVMTNYTNGVAQTPPNEEFGEQTWRGAS